MPIRYGNNGGGGGGNTGNPINGTEVIGADFGLGGELMQNTEIDAATNSFKLFDVVGGGELSILLDNYFANKAAGQQFILNDETFASGVYADFSAFCYSLFQNNATGKQIVHTVSRNDINSTAITTTTQLARQIIDPTGLITNEYTNAAIFETSSPFDPNLFNIKNGFASYSETYPGPEADTVEIYRYDTNIGLPVDMWQCFSLGILGIHNWEIGDIDNYRTNRFLAIDEQISMSWGSTKIAGVQNPPTAQVKCDTQGVHFKGAIHTGEVETVSATAIQATYTKRLAIYDLTDTLVGYVPLMDP
jgi:hypothetical protein